MAEKLVERVLVRAETGIGHQVERLAARPVERLLPVPHGDDLEALAHEPIRHEVDDPRLVVDEQDAAAHVR